MNKNYLGTASLVLGIIGLLLSCIFIGIIPCIISIILAICGLSKKDSKHGYSIAGLICSIIGIIIFLGVFLVAFSSDAPTTNVNEEVAQTEEITAIPTESVETTNITADSKEATVPTETEEATVAPSEDTDIPTEYKSALKSAESYSDMMHMSKKAIYDQLVSEYGGQFTADEAQYAIDNLE